MKQCLACDSAFFRGPADKYTWCDLGSNDLPGELIATFLWAQMEAADDIITACRTTWQRYHQALAPHELTAFIDGLQQRGVHAVFHYIPLHTAPAGLRYGRPHGICR
ncbi:PLP-dependent aminotransferase family protein [Pseudothauera nasutitermitis]|uniref:hypothetical protein n=1 Tax=Pseudothauera nasutitermitis TaxID=2565930 RepID=UPI001B3B2386|nr:hypothetical protein [Pseudothauera nasutitermitis]